MDKSGLLAIVVDHDSLRRQRLISAARALVDFRRVLSVAHVKELLPTLQEQGNTDIIFLGSSIPVDLRAEVISSSKTLNEDIAIITVNSPSDNLVGQLFKGSDGVLCEPFSVNGLSEVVDVSRSLKQINHQRRRKAIIELMVKEALKELDQIILKPNLDLHRESSKIFSELKKILEYVGLLSEEELELYFEFLELHSSNSQPVIRPVVKKNELKIRRARSRWERV